MPLWNESSRASSKRFGSAILLFVLALAASAASSIFPDPEGEYLAEVWRTEDGLPQNSVTSVVQTPDGYLWLGTFNGLARFNGTAFKVFDTLNAPALGSARIVRMIVDHERALWVMSEEGAIARVKEGEIRAVGPADGLAQGGSRLVGADPAGKVWILSLQTKDLYRGDNGRFARAPASETLTTKSLAALRADHTGRLWMRRGSEWLDLEKQSMAGFLNCAAPRRVAIGEVAPGRDDSLWICTECEIVEIRNGERARSFPIEIEDIGNSALLEDREGNLWLGTWAHGLIRFGADGSKRTFDFSGGIERPAIRALHEDEEGNIWVGLDGGGLCRMRKRIFQTYAVEQGLGGPLVRSIVEDDGNRLWIFNHKNVDRLRPGPGVRRVETSSLRIGTPWCALPGPSGEIWVGTRAGAVYVCREDIAVKQVIRGPASPENCTVLFREKDGTLWLGAVNGLWRHTGDGFDPAPPESQAVGTDVRALANDTAGNLYVGLNGGGLLVRQNGAWKKLARTDGLPSDRVWSLFGDGEGNLWIGTLGGGLVRFREGRFFVFPSSDFGLPHTVGSILEDNLGFLWFGTAKGLLRARRSELENFAAGRTNVIATLQFGRGDGMGSGECASGSQPVAWKARDGRLWFATVNGASVVDPAKLKPNPRPPPVAIEEVVVDGKIFPLAPASAGQSSRRMVLPSGTQRMEFHFAALTYTAPAKARYQHKLDGLDDAWIMADDRRSATYTEMAPGNYLFRVTACNSDGIWSEQGESLAVAVLPHYWQTTWFMTVAAFAGCGLLFAVYHTRVRRLKHARVLQEAFSRRLIDSQEAERKRIASDLHDGLGQNLLVIKTRAAFTLTGVTASPTPAEALAEISQIASETLEEVREISRNLRPYQLDRLNLTKALQALGRRVGKGLPLDVRLEIDPIDDLFPAEKQIHLYRIVQEALNNIVKHSGARQARVTVQRRAGTVNLRIEDDGKGFDLAALAEPAGQIKGLGLTSITERVRFLGGTLKFDSAPGQGTRLEIELPVANRP